MQIFNEKKFVQSLILVFCLVAILSFAGCKTKPPQPPTVEPPTTPPVSNQEPDVTQGMSCEEAIQKVKNLDEIADYLSRVPKAKVECDSQEEDGTWLVHTYEIVMDKGVSHIATFDWYYVYPNGTVESMFDFEVEE